MNWREYLLRNEFFRPDFCWCPDEWLPRFGSQILCSEYYHKYVKSGEFGGEAMMESVAGPIEFVDFDNEEVWLGAYEYFSWVLRQGLNRDYVVISFPQIILEVNTFFHLVFVCILPQ